jgi:hypothetical protein
MRGRYQGKEGAKGRSRILRRKDWRSRRYLYEKASFNDFHDLFIICLKVGGIEKQCGSGRSQMLDNSLGPWRSRFIFNLNMQFLSNMSYFRFRL